MEVEASDTEKWGKRVDWAFQKGWKEVCKSDLFKIKGIPMETEMEVR
jgi:hypothetical protein